MNTPAHILVVEDEPRISEVVIAYLQHAGHRTQLVESGDKVLAAIAKRIPSLIILDLMLPGLDGVSICKAIRQSHDFPIIMVTAKVEEIDRLLGFEVGADDYVCKPFSPNELVARVNALLRRSNPILDTKQTPLLHNDTDAQRIYCEGNALQLTPQEYRLLSILIASPSRVYSRAQLIDLAYDSDTETFDRTVDSHIKNIRKRLKQQLGELDVIHSVYGVGYRYEDQH